MDGDASNNFGAALVGVRDLHQGLDKWHEAVLSVQRPGWRMFRVDVEDGRLRQMPTSARFVVAGETLLFVIPLTEFDAAPGDSMGYRLSTFSYEAAEPSNELVTGAADVSTGFDAPLPRVGV